MDCVRCEDLAQRVKVPIGGGTDILKADNTITFKKGLNMTKDLEKARGNTARKRKAA